MPLLGRCGHLPGTECRINLVRNTTLNQTDYRIYNAADNTDITEVHKV